MDLNSTILLQILQIIWIDIILSGDNAVVIALACRQLPPHQRRMGIVLGAGAAVLLRILFALVISYLMGLPFLKIVGGLLLLWIAVKLIVGEDEHEDVQASDKLWRAIWTIMIADAVMSLDNVIAISAAAKGNVWLFIFGLALSIPLVIGGSTLVMAMIARFPIIVWAGAALLGWIAGEMLVSDVAFIGWLKDVRPNWLIDDPSALPLKLSVFKSFYYGAAFVGAAIVIAIGFWLKARQEARQEAR